MTHPEWSDPHAAGPYIMRMLSTDNPNSAQHQLDVAYRHGGGWHPFNGFELVKTQKGYYALKYPGDPLMKELSRCYLRDETVVLFQYSWVGVIQPDGTYGIARMD
jgi:hypothetical protein